MYIPEFFREDDPAILKELIAENSFGLLVSVHDGVPFASHLPFLIEAGPDGRWKLSSHMARANPQWKELRSDREILAVFSGPHAYVSPSWYHSPGVPTWNYTAVHCYGVARLLEDRNSLGTLLQRLTAYNEAKYGTGWTFDPQGSFRSLLDIIVGFEIEVTRVEGKFKLSQNRSGEDLSSVIGHLNSSANFLANRTAELMSRLREKEPESGFGPKANERKGIL